MTDSNGSGNNNGGNGKSINASVSYAASLIAAAALGAGAGALGSNVAAHARLDPVAIKLVQEQIIPHELSDGGVLFNVYDHVRETMPDGGMRSRVKGRAFEGPDAVTVQSYWDRARSLVEKP